MKREYVLALFRPGEVLFYSRKSRKDGYIWGKLKSAKLFRTKLDAERFFYPIWGYGANAMTVVQAKKAIESYR